MIIEVETTRGYSADMLSIKIMQSLLTILLDETFDRSGLPEEPPLNEISIFAGGISMARALHLADKDESKKYIYIVTETVQDAKNMHDSLQRWVSKPETLGRTLKTIDPSLSDFCWEGIHFEILVSEIADILAASTLVLPGEVSRKCFKGSMSWTEQ